MKRRLFIAVPIPDAIKDKIDEILGETRASVSKDIRFLKKDIWHLTLVFLGYQEELSAPRIEEAMREAAAEFGKSLPVIFESVSYGPPGRTPRMIWLNTARVTSNEMSVLKKVLEEKLQAAGIRWQRENRPYEGHVTLARFAPASGRLKLEELGNEINLEYSAPSLDLMESRLLREGAEYSQVSSVALNQNFP